MTGLTDKPFINISYLMNNIRIYYIEHEFFAYCVDAENIVPICDKRAKIIANSIIEKTSGTQLINLTFAFPSTFKDSRKEKIRELCRNQLLDQSIMMKMLVLLI